MNERRNLRVIGGVHQPFALLHRAIRGWPGRSLVAARWQNGFRDVDLEVSPVQLSRVLALLVLDYLCAGLHDVRATPCQP